MMPHRWTRDTILEYRRSLLFYPTQVTVLADGIFEQTLKGLSHCSVKREPQKINIMISAEPSQD